MREIVENTSLSPLFIVGLPRSGTKLLRGILNNHDDIFIPSSESMFIPYMLDKYGLEPDFTFSRNRESFISDLLETTYFYNLSLSIDNLKNDSFRDILKTNSWQLIFKYILNDLVNDNPNNVIFGDKTPRYINHIDVLGKIYPKAKFLHIIRDPRDQCVSSKKAWGKSLYRSAQIWRDSIINARKLATNNQLSYLEIRYEDLLENPEETVMNVCEYINCQYNSSMLVFDETVEEYGSARGLRIIKRNNYNKFHETLKKYEIKRIESIVFDIMHSCQYDLINDINSQNNLNYFEKQIYKIHDFLYNYLFHIKDKGLLEGIRYIRSLAKTKSRNI